jgi:hypothetical protein
LPLPARAGREVVRLLYVRHSYILSRYVAVLS